MPAWIVGCTDEEARRGEPSAPSDARPVTRRAEKGPVSLTLSASSAEQDRAGRLTVRMEVIAAQDVTVNPRSYVRALTTAETRYDYAIVNCAEVEAGAIDAGNLRWVYECELDFFLAGEYDLPAAEVTFVDTRGPSAGDDVNAADLGPAATESLATEKLSVVIHKPAGQVPSAEELAEIKTLDPVELPRELSRWWLVAPLIAAAAVCAIVLARRTRRSRAARVEAIPPDVWARRELSELIAEDLIARGLVQRFYYRISDIIRGYVERRFDISAPEMTTEEFLSHAAGHPQLGAQHTAGLEQFLEECDLVKYARHKPRPDRHDGLLQAAGVFVERTRPKVTKADMGDGLPQAEGRAA